MGPLTQSMRFAFGGQYHPGIPSTSVVSTLRNVPFPLWGFYIALLVPNKKCLIWHTKV
jgi:hypothetical protein